MTVAVLASAMTGSDHKITAGLVELASQKPGLVEALEGVKYDKIAQVVNILCVMVNTLPYSCMQLCCCSAHMRTGSTTGS